MNEFDSPLSEKKVRVIIFFTPDFDHYFHLTYRQRQQKWSAFIAFCNHWKFVLHHDYKKDLVVKKQTSHNTVFTLKNKCTVYKSLLQKNWMLRYLEATSCKPNWNILQFFYNINKINDHYARNMIMWLW